MLNIFEKINGMSIVGQGGKIILFTLPSLLVAIFANTLIPQIASLPIRYSFLKPLGYLLLVPGLIYWGTAVVQLLIGFSKGRLITTGAYAIARNPIYSSVTFFVLPGVALISQNWVYLVAALFLFVGVQVFIGKEEHQLNEAFGKQYEDYLEKVNRLIPFAKG